MNKIVLLLILSTFTGGVFAQTKKPKPAISKEAAAPDQDADAPKKGVESPAKTIKPTAEDADKAMTDYMSPGEKHAQLALAAGDWKEEIQLWMEPGAEAKVNTLNCRISMVMDGRFQESVHTGEIDGMNFHGLGYTGYDKASKKFVSTWMDNMSTGIMYMSGTMDEEGAIVFKGEQTDPVSGKSIKVREVYRILNDSEHTIEMYNTLPGGREYKSMEIHLRK